MTEPSDDYLMGRFAAGDYAAFEILYGRHKDAVYRYFLRGTHAASAADGHQEAWARVVANSGRYRAQGRFRAWLFKIAHNVLMDQFRQPRHGPVSEDEAVANGSPLQDVEYLEAAERLDALIAALPVAQREALLLHKEAGLTVREIASVAGITEEGVKSRLRYAMEKLRKGMRGYV
ncbi:MAG: sigma-70 family RNA polymerase sigma factor [Gammaproteobacteria bacterium]|nr:sigma-70 family RNA polymerase sigma factor [Gammaproteobacteria bacterium]